MTDICVLHFPRTPRLTVLARVATLVCLVCPGTATATEGALCLEAARRAAEVHDIPADVLIALALTETGKQREGATVPWPWAVNDGGTGHWFETRDQAIAFAYDRYKSGARNFDVGCFQLNFRWHSGAFASLDEMFDPVSNADYAARFLVGHYAETGDWTEAAGRYHSLTEVHASRYRTIFASYRNEVDALPDAAVAEIASSGIVGGLAALATTSGHRASGSLVSLARDVRPLFSPAQSLF